MPYIRIVRLMCTGRVDLEFILRAFKNGNDGVFIAGCKLGECHYITEGNYDALNLAHLTWKLMEERLGIDPNRLRVEWISAGEGNRFADVMDEFGQQLREMGPLGKAEGIEQDELEARIEEVRELVPYIKIEMREKLDQRFRNAEDYKTLYTSEDIEQLFSETASYYIDPEKCRACMICAKRCPVDAIWGGKNKIHVIDQEKCIKCATCYEACPPRFSAIERLPGTPVPDPIPEEEREIARAGSKESS